VSVTYTLGFVLWFWFLVNKTVLQGHDTALDYFADYIHL